MKINRLLKDAALALALGAALSADATDYFWYGRGADTLWTTTENWSTTRDEYTPSTKSPASKNNDYVYVNTAVSGNHAFTISIPASTGSLCQRIYILDDSAPGSVTIEGIGENHTSIIPALNAVTWQGENPMTLTLRNLTLNNYTFPFGYSECDGNGLVIENCFSALTSNSYYFKLPPGNGGTVAIVDSVITNNFFKRVDNVVDYGSLTFAVTNSSLRCNYFTIPGSNTVVDVVGSTFAFSSNSSIGGANEAAAVSNQNVSVHFKDSSIIAQANSFFYISSTNSKTIFDGVDFLGNPRGLNFTGEMSLTNSSCRFDRGNSSGTGNGNRGIQGTLRLDHSEWIITNGYSRLIGPLHVVISGAAPRFEPADFSGNYALTLDFVVPKGGYAFPPVSRADVNGRETLSFFPAGSTVNVLPESRAARVTGTGVYPLIYLKSTKTVCNLVNAPLTTLPNDKSKFLMTTDYSWEYADVNGKAESDWTQVASGYNSNVAGVAVKIVGKPPGTVIIVQ